MLLEARELSKRFGGVKAVDEVSWSIDRGETRCIIGPNGAGKSTFFQLLVGRLTPDAGTIVYDGANITRRHPFERARLGIAVKPQTLGVFAELTVEHNLRLSLQRAFSEPERTRRIEERLAALGLAEKAGFLTKELSHGEKQWLGIGMAMAAQPSLLLLDEPTAGMSPAETERTVEMIRQVAAAGTSVLAIEHDMAFVRSLAATTTVFHNGRVFVTGTITDIESNGEVQRLYLGKRGAAKLRH
jgi:branched-chain amino acid transport system ATP-binding protein